MRTKTNRRKRPSFAPPGVCDWCDRRRQAVREAMRKLRAKRKKEGAIDAK